ncbi:phosphoribosyltransferase-like protein [Bacillus cereus]|uniref:phosphoribosyltransferase-like protein n=1 Tax=Bacillus cereus TaxID=1396 RepID=UPI000818752F|nr:hypothetical protein [Bacillus cereus]
MRSISVSEFKKLLKTAPSIVEINYERYFNVYNSCTDTKRLLTTFGRERVSEWLEQFSEEDQEVAIEVFTSIKYFDEELVRTLCQIGYFELVSILKSLGRSTLFIGVGGSGKSGQMIAYLFRTANSIPEGHFKFISEVGEEDLKKYQQIVFLDDIIGSGKQFIDYWDLNVKPVMDKNSVRKRFFLISLTGTRIGISNINKAIPNIKIIVPHIREKQYYSTKEYDVLKKYGDGLWKNGHELGWNNSGETVVFFYNVPNNTLPILWSTRFSKVTGDKWKPLQQRATTIGAKISKKNVIDVLRQYIYRESFSSHEYMVIMKIMLESYTVLEPGDLTGKEMFKFGQLASDFFAPYEGKLSHGAIFECLPNLRRGIANVFYEYVRTQPTKELFREFLYFFILDEYTRHPNDSLQWHLVELGIKLLKEFPDLEEVVADELGRKESSECLIAQGSYIILKEKNGEISPNTLSRLQYYRDNGVDQSKYLSELLLCKAMNKTLDYSGIDLSKVYFMINVYGQMKIWSIMTINEHFKK